MTGSTMESDAHFADGDIVLVDFRPVIGREQDGMRPALVMTDEAYEGWTNYPTWVVKLWLDNEQGSYYHVTGHAEEAWTDAREDEDNDEHDVLETLPDKSESNLESSPADQLQQAQTLEMIEKAVEKSDYKDAIELINYIKEKK